MRTAFELLLNWHVYTNYLKTRINRAGPIVVDNRGFTIITSKQYFYGVKYRSFLEGGCFQKKG